jgi:hypothetical protein
MRQSTCQGSILALTAISGIYGIFGITGDDCNSNYNRFSLELPRQGSAVAATTPLPLIPGDPENPEDP